jgi:hypothetical protein
LPVLDALQRKFPRDALGRVDSVGVATKAVAPEEVSQLLCSFGGASFGSGVYRIVHPSDLSAWHDRIHLAYPQSKDCVTCFGFDWLGRAFALDNKRLQSGKPRVIMFEPGTGEALEIPANLQSFHEEVLIDDGEAALAISGHEKWLAGGGAAPNYKQCVGYRKPLFLGGADELWNMELSDLDVYWHVVGQLVRETRGLPPGTPIRAVLD